MKGVIVKKAKQKPLGKREQMRHVKSALRNDIHSLQSTIRVALNAPRVPPRVLAADATGVAAWKAAMERAPTLSYHVANSPAKRMTAAGLAKVRARLPGVLQTIA